MGRADTQAWLSHVQAEKGDALLLDCAGEQPYLTVLGSIQLRMRAAGQITEQVWTDPIWAWPFNPGEWQTFEATIIDGDEVTWMVPAADRVEAGEIRIGRALDEVEALASMPVDTMGFLINPDIPDHERRARRRRPRGTAGTLHAHVVRGSGRRRGPVPRRDQQRPGVAAPRLAHPDAEEVPEAAAEHVEEPPEEVPAKEPEQPSGELYVVADAEEPPVDTAESAERQGGFGESGTPASSESAPEAAPESPAIPEAMSAEGLAGLGAETDTEATILRLAPANSGPAAPVAFLIHGGTVPVEVSRDVVIGRDPDARALTGRPVATVLRVPSPETEISRSHCAVMMTTPGSWALMDLGSANGTVLRHADGSFQDVTPMVTIALNDGDLIDVGEGTTIEFRVR